MKPVALPSYLALCIAYTLTAMTHAESTRPNVPVTIFNNTNRVMYPVIRDVVNHQEKRIYIRGASGIPAHSQAKAIITGDMGDAGQILIFSQPPTNMPGEPTAAILHSKGIKDSDLGNIIYTQSLTDAFRADEPSQLLEYTIDGGVDTGNIDFDYSGVDELTIPFAIEATDNNGVAVRGYAGTTIDLDTMQSNLSALISGGLTGHYFSKNHKVGWNYYYNGQNPQALIKIPTAYNSFAEVGTSSYLVNPPQNNTKLVANVDGAPRVGTLWTSDVLTERWLGWLSSKYTGSSFNVPATDQVEQVIVPGEFATGCTGDSFCQSFAGTVQMVFDAAAANLKHRGVIIHGVNNFADARVVMTNLMGYSFSSDPKLPNYLPDNVRDAYKAIMRGAPTPADERNPNLTSQLHPSPAGSSAKYNLNVIDWFVHRLLGFYGYGFSIDDDRGNIRSPGTKLIITIGGPNGLPFNQPFDPIHQQTVIFGAGWSGISSGSDNYGDVTGALSTCKLGSAGAGSCFVGVDATHQNGKFNHVVAWLGGSSGSSLSLDLVSSSTDLGFTHCQVNNHGSAQINTHICSVINHDPTFPFFLTIPDPGAGGGSNGGGGNNPSTIFFPTGWGSFSSSDCPLNTNINGESIPSTKIGGIAGAVGFKLSQNGSCSFKAMDTSNNVFSYKASFTTASGALTCTQGCISSAAPVTFSTDKKTVTVTFPQPQQEGPAGTPSGGGGTFQIYLGRSQSGAVWTSVGPATTCKVDNFNPSSFSISFKTAQGCVLELSNSGSSSSAPADATFKLLPSDVTCVLTASKQSCRVAPVLNQQTKNVNLPDPDGTR
ncbi:hypothetical protein EO087_10345 [Dyella sp. M7H15-1]|uniref:hypothetical protein n=1 Tax=Dyella sp. M7H15-1 TaxID=2501295 RepID=UPI001004D87A|nr:hypothetical protein [Dyella sp. M7H15-1]QAU24340.1 hypothetical protein EO087_10345 [Dyella sp. M7H15-1]